MKDERIQTVEKTAYDIIVVGGGTCERSIKKERKDKGFDIRVRFNRKGRTRKNP